MKKVLLSLALVAFVGSATIAAVNMNNDVAVEMTQDQDKKKDAKKAKSCTKEEKASTSKASCSKGKKSACCAKGAKKAEAKSTAKDSK